MALLSNPYIAGNPVRGEEHFVGRNGILRDVLRLLDSPQSNAIVLYGQRRIGKTSILFQIEQQLAESGEYLPVYFDLHDKADLSLSQILYLLAGQIARHVDIPPITRECFDDEGCFFRSDFLPDTVSKSRKGLVLLFDEFDVLDRPYKGQVGATFLPYLRKWVAKTNQVHFVLAMGRRPEDLSSSVLSTFKDVRIRLVSLMDLPESLGIIRQSEHNQTLYWSEAAVSRVCYWTQGHPYLTQLLCSEIWEEAYDDDPETVPTAEPDHVDQAIEATLEQGANAFQWIWNGLPPAERVIIAALAETGLLTISPQQLSAALMNNDIPIPKRDMEMAPDTLIRWGLLRKNGLNYRFSIPLLQKWVAENKPVKRIKGEIERLEPAASSLVIEAGQNFDQGDLTRSEGSLRRSLAIDPSHVGARLLLGQVHLKKGNNAEAVAVLESAYNADPAAAREDLIKALLALAGSQEEEDEQWRTLGRVLRIDPQQPAALDMRNELLRNWAQLAADRGEYDAALRAYEQLGDNAGKASIRVVKTKRSLAALLPWSSRRA
jgi:branched-chain amino acid transport system substrate-binding protein